MKVSVDALRQLSFLYVLYKLFLNIFSLRDAKFNVDLHWPNIEGTLIFKAFNEVHWNEGWKTHPYKYLMKRRRVRRFVPSRKLHSESFDGRSNIQVKQRGLFILGEFALFFVDWCANQTKMRTWTLNFTEVIHAHDLKVSNISHQNNFWKMQIFAKVVD